MKHVLFGRSGLRVSELCLGAMQFGDPQRPSADAKESRAIFDAFAEAGGTFIDTADGYAFGESEKLVGEFVRADRDHFTIASKYTNGRTTDLMKGGNSRKNMMRAVEGSLKRLGVDRIDLYYLHMWDFTTPWDEILRGLDDLVRAGKIHYAAVSNTPAWEIARANMMADLRGWAPFVGMQINYNLAERSPERELLPMAKALDLGVTVWGPLAGGLLTGRYRAGTPASDTPVRRKTGDAPERTLSIGDLVVEIAQARGASPAQVALAWLRAHTQYGRIIPILGPRTLAQFVDTLKCRDVTLDADELKRLDEATRIEKGFPYSMIESRAGRALAHAQQTDRLSGHRNFFG